MGAEASPYLRGAVLCRPVSARFLWRPQLAMADEMVLRNSTATLRRTGPSRDSAIPPNISGLALLSPRLRRLRRISLKKQTGTYPLRLRGYETAVNDRQQGRRHFASISSSLTAGRREDHRHEMPSSSLGCLRGTQSQTSIGEGHAVFLCHVSPNTAIILSIK